MSKNPNAWKLPPLTTQLQAINRLASEIEEAGGTVNIPRNPETRAEARSLQFALRQKRDALRGKQ